MKIKSLLLGLLLFSFLMINTVLDGAVIYLQLLKHKQDPNKFIILVADIHGLHPEIEKMQIRITDDLLAILKKLLQPLNVELNLCYSLAKAHKFHHNTILHRC